MSIAPIIDVRSLADRPASVTLSAPTILAQSFRRFDCFEVKLREGGTETTFKRDVLRVGDVVGVLPVDPVRGEIVLLRQFRLPAHLALDKGEMIEIVAGGVEIGEQVVGAGRRECKEEVGIEPTRLVPLFKYLPAPGVADELVHLLLAEIDASKIPDRAGALGEAESTWPIRVTVDDAVEVLKSNVLHSGLTIVALSWVALNRHGIREILASA